MPTAQLLIVSRTIGIGSKPTAVAFLKDTNAYENHLGFGFLDEIKELSKAIRPITVADESQASSYAAADVVIRALTGGYSLDPNNVTAPHYWNGERWVRGGDLFTWAFPLKQELIAKTIPSRMGGVILQTELLVVVAG